MFDCINYSTMEFDIPDTLQWHTISMTTRNFDAKPGDYVFAQLAFMDWGLEKYQIDVDYFRVNIVRVDTIGPDKGMPLPYHPPVPVLETLNQHLPVNQDCMIDIQYPDLNFNRWGMIDKNKFISLLTVNHSQIILLKWDLDKYRDKKAKGVGLLELTTASLQRSPEYEKDFCMIRVVEILKGDPEWDQTTVTCQSFCQENDLDRVLNSQMIIDVNVAENRCSKSWITISQPVLQRMIDGQTLGLAIRHLGAIDASFYAMENEDSSFTPQLHFNIQ